MRVTHLKLKLCMARLQHVYNVLYSVHPPAGVNSNMYIHLPFIVYMYVQVFVVFGVLQYTAMWLRV